MSYTATVLNAIRDNATTDYVDRVPAATQANITAVGNAILNYTSTVNEFTNALVNKIAMTIISSKMATNRLAGFKKGFLPYGKTIEEVFVAMASASTFDKEGLTVLARTLPEIKSMYHSENREDYYKCSISDAQLHLCFTSESGMQDLISAIVNSMMSGSEYDEFILMKRLLCDYELNYFDYGVTAITDAATAQAFLKTVRKAVADMSFMSDVFNAAGVKTFCTAQDQVLIINKDVISNVDVDVLAKTFNLGKTDFEPRIVVIDSFDAMTDTLGVLVDKDFFMVWDTLRTTKTQENAQGLFTNYFLHIHQILSTSKFKNTIRFTTEPKA